MLREFDSSGGTLDMHGGVHYKCAVSDGADAGGGAFIGDPEGSVEGGIHMKRVTGVLCIILGLAVFSVATASAQIEQAPATPRFERGDGAEAVGAEIFDRIIYLPVMLNGAGPFIFVLDTGAGPFSAVDQSAAESLKMHQTPIATGGGAGEDMVQITRVDSVAISMPGLSFGERTVAGIPLHRMDPHWGKRKDGLIGGDLLSTMVTFIDYDRKRIEFRNAAAYEYEGPGEGIPVQILGGFIFIEATVFLYGKEEPVDAFFMLDTGVRISTFNAPYSMRHALPAQSPKTTSGITGFGIGGVSRGIVGRVRGIRIGSFLVEDPVVDFSTDERGALADTNFSGIIGADILCRFNVVLDYARSRIFLEKNRLFGDPFEFDMCGIRFAMEGERFDRIKVFSIFGGSPAADAGIAEGDIVAAIDGRPAGGFTREILREYLQREGATVRFTIERGGETKDVTIRLRRMV